MNYTYKCPNCGQQFITQTPAQRVRCPFCQNEFQVAVGQPQNAYSGKPQEIGVFDAGPSGKSRGVAALLAILLGALGIHYFYIGKSTAGIVFLLAGIISCGILAAVTSIIAIVQGVLFLTVSQEEFERRWVNNQSSVPLF